MHPARRREPTSSFLENNLVSSPLATTLTPNGDTIPLTDRSASATATISAHSRSQPFVESSPAFMPHVVFRPARRRDIADLHRHCILAFPVRYNDAYYQEMIELGVTLLAVARVSAEELAQQPESVAGGNSLFYDRSIPEALSEQASLNLDCLVAEDESYGHVVGEIMVRLEEEEFGWLNGLLEQFCGWRRTRRAYIATLSVETALQRHGLGSTLLAQMLVKLERERVSHVTLHVKADNFAAIEFYQKEGFEIWRKLPRHYFINGQREDALLMGRELLATGSGVPDAYFVGSPPQPLTVFNFFWRFPQTLLHIATTAVREESPPRRRVAVDDV